MADNGTYSGMQPEPITLKRLEEIMLRFSDRMPAIPTAVKMNGHTWDVLKDYHSDPEFMAERTGTHPPFSFVEVVIDDTVPPGEWRWVYADGRG